MCPVVTTLVALEHTCLISSSSLDAVASISSIHNKRPLIDVTTTTTSTTSNKRARLIAPTTRQTLQFSPLPPQIWDIPTRHELTEDERQQCFYTKDDLKQMRRQAVQLTRQPHTVKKLQKMTTNLEATLFDPRGLERRSKQGVKQFRANKTKAYRTVLQAQQLAKQRQSMLATTTPIISISKLYHDVCHPCVVEAQRLALLDAQDAQQIYQESAATITSTALFNNNTTITTIIDATNDADNAVTVDPPCSCTTTTSVATTITNNTDETVEPLLAAVA